MWTDPTVSLGALQQIAALLAPVPWRSRLARLDSSADGVDSFDGLVFGGIVNMTHASRQSGAPEGSAGFTLIEIIVVLAILGILVTIAVPTLVSRRVAANEAAVISTLRAVSQAQFQFKAMASLDLDRDWGCRPR
jgi:prepilin-type N-terminal cleavage/methylation domain-containing protein